MEDELDAIANEGTALGYNDGRILQAI